MHEYDWKGILGEGAAGAALFAFFGSIGLSIVDAASGSTFPQAVFTFGIPALALLGFLVGAIHQYSKQQGELIRTAAFEAAQAAAAQRSDEQTKKAKKSKK